MSGSSRPPKSQLTESWRDYINKNGLILLMFVVMVVAKFVASRLPAKYTYDNMRILGMTNNDPHVYAWAGTYVTAADIFKKVNFFNFNQLNQWSIFLGLIMMLTVLFITARIPEPDFCQVLFFLACVGLLNIYVFNIGKDVIQYVMFFLVYLVITLPFRAPIFKLIVSAIILAYESTFFRPYYILIAAFAVGMFVILQLLCRRTKLSPSRTLLGIGIGSYLLVCLMMVVALLIMPEEYNYIMGVRSSQTDTRVGNADASTIIQDLIPGSSLPMFLVNYLINAVRMMIPVELFMHGVGYLPFLVFQLALTWYMAQLMRKIRNINDDKQFIALAIFMGYVLASFMFEPDFGSWLRHESSTFPVMILLVMSENQRASEWKNVEPLTGSALEDRPSQLRWFAKKEA